MPKPKNCSWYPGKISKIGSVEVVVGHISLLEPYYRNEILARRSPSIQPVVDLGNDIWEVAKV